jgi:cytochrome d ubiquinol oxidase subunit I
VYGVLRTADAVTPMPGLVGPFVAITLLYAFLGFVVAYLLYWEILRTARGPGS